MMEEEKDLKFYPLGICPECGGTLQAIKYIWKCNSCEFNTAEGDEE